VAAVSPFLVSVGDILPDSGHRPIEIAEIVDWSLELSRVTEFDATLTLQGASGSLVLTGRLRATVHHTCNRCVAEWDEAVEVETLESIGADPAGAYMIDGEVADLEPPLRDALLMALPTSPQCRSDCLGLCDRCGADLNTGACPGHDDDVESPFSSLYELLEP